MSRIEVMMELAIEVRIRKRETGAWEKPDVDTMIDGWI